MDHDGSKKEPCDLNADSLPDFKVLPYPTEPDWLDAHADKKDSPTSDTIPITLNSSAHWTYCGPLLTLEESSLPSSFHTWAQATINGSLLTPLFSFLAYVHEFLMANNLAHYWLTVRATKGSEEFDIPRWHTDDLFFTPLPSQSPSQTPSLWSRQNLKSALSNNFKSTKPKDNSLYQQKKNQNIHSRKNSIKASTTDPYPTLSTPAQIFTPTLHPPNWKLSTTLLGPGTIFINEKSSKLAREIQTTTKQDVRNMNSDHICLSIRCVGCASSAETIRTRLATDLKPYGVVQARTGQCVFFRVGEKEGAVHSEPRSHGDRIFVNVVPGKEVDLKCLMTKWGMEFPRAWCVGLPFYLEEGSIYRNVGEV